MKNKFPFRKWTNRFFILIFCLILLLYTMTFPSNTSWFIFIFFALLFLVLFFSTSFSWGETTAILSNEPDGTIDIQMNAKTRMGLPIFLPFIHLQLKIDKEFSEVEIPVYFQNQVHILFQDVHFPRGHFNELILCTYGKDHFGVFTHYSEKKIRTDINIYPHHYSKYKSNHYLQKIYTHPFLHQYLSMHSPQFHQIREYQSQDSIKQIDWKTSMRKKKMMVKEFENEIIPTLTIVFVGMQSEYFEPLLSLAYSLYLDLQNLIQLKLSLIGTFEGKSSVQVTLSSFLTIESESHIESILKLYKVQSIQTGYKIVIAPETMRSFLQIDAKKNFIYFSEKDLYRSEVNK